MDKATIKEKVEAMISAPSCCAELKTAGERYLKAIGTPEEKDEAKKKNEDYYSLYFNTAKSVIKKSINTHDDATLFLFNNHRVTGRKIIKRMQLDPQNIELPPELMDLAKRMPDAEDVMHLVDNQQDKNTPKE